MKNVYVVDLKTLQRTIKRDTNAVDQCLKCLEQTTTMSWNKFQWVRKWNGKQLTCRHS